MCLSHLYKHFNPLKIRILQKVIFPNSLDISLHFCHVNLLKIKNLKFNFWLKVLLLTWNVSLESQEKLSPSGYIVLLGRYSPPWAEEFIFNFHLKTEPFSTFWYFITFLPPFSTCSTLTTYSKPFPLSKSCEQLWCHVIVKKTTFVSGKDLPGCPMLTYLGDAGAGWQLGSSTHSFTHTNTNTHEKFDAHKYTHAHTHTHTHTHIFCTCSTDTYTKTRWNQTTVHQTSISTLQEQHHSDTYQHQKAPSINCQNFDGDLLLL